VTETIEPTSSDAGTAAAPKKKSGGLNTMLLADLKSMAGGLGIRGVGSMKKAQLVEAIKRGDPVATRDKARKHYDNAAQRLADRADFVDV